MKYNEVTIYTAAEAIEPLCSLLEEFAPDGFITEDGSSITECIDNSSVYYDYIDDELRDRPAHRPYIRFYMPEEKPFEALQERLESIKALPLFEGLEVSVQPIDDTDWANNWKKDYTAVPIGKKLIIKPTWIDLPDTMGRVVIELDPGSSFGSGTHATTRMCMEAIENYMLPESSVLDLGCGSGILGLAAIKLGAVRAEFIDIDPNCIVTTTENLQQNGIPTDGIMLRDGNILDNAALVAALQENPVDIMAVNIVADVIAEMSPLFRSFIKKDGIIVASGILEEAIPKVRRAFEWEGFSPISCKTSQGWACLVYCTN